MEGKKRGRPAKKKVTPETEPIQIDSVEGVIETVKDKAYFRAKLETLAEEIQLAIKLDRSLSIRLKSVYTSINQAAKKL